MANSPRVGGPFAVLDAAPHSGHRAGRIETPLVDISEAAAAHGTAERLART